MRRFLAALTDHAMCAMMDWRQRRHRLAPGFRDEWLGYVAEHQGAARPDHFAAPALDTAEVNGALVWNSPVSSGHAENHRCRALLFPCAAGWSAPTVLMLHALMSASDRGYRGWARQFNARGWNAAFIHLPYHYTRTPRGHWNGELAITADAIRTCEGLRAGAAECRQLMAWLRARGCREFGLWACSYGGWIGGLLASVESDFRFAALIEPIVDVHHAIWKSPAGRSVRRGLKKAGVSETDLASHFPLMAPNHSAPAFSNERVIFAAGAYDHIARLAEIRALSEKWSGSELLVEPQGHFGYRLMRAVWRELEKRGL
jgi:hypothetical protein